MSIHSCNRQLFFFSKVYAPPEALPSSPPRPSPDPPPPRQQHRQQARHNCQHHLDASFCCRQLLDVVWRDQSRRVKLQRHPETDRKSTRLNSSHSQISYAVFCLKKRMTPHTSP